MPVFQHQYGDAFESKYIIPATWLGVWSAASPLGIMVGSMTAGWIHDRFGRRWSLAFGSSIGAIGVAICLASSFSDDINVRRGIFLLGKFFEGQSSGMVVCTAQTYVSEIAPQSLRAPSFAMFPTFLLLGQLLGAVVLFSQIHIPTSRGYLACIASQWAPSVALFLAATIIPESPTWLLRKDNMALARKSQRRLQQEGHDLDAVIDELVAVLEQEKTESLYAGAATFKQCFTGTNRRRTLIIIFANALPQLFGSVLIAHASYIFQILGVEAALAVELLQVGISIGLVANFISIWTLSRFGRRPLAITTLTVCSLLYLGLGISGFWKGKLPLWWAVVSIILVLFVIGLGVWPISVLAAAETSSLQLRGKSQAIGWLVHGLGTGIFSIFLPYVYNPDSGNAGGKTGFLFFGLCLISAVGIWAFLPEMQGRSQAEIDSMFTHNVPTRKWKDWNPESIEETEKDDSSYS
ncbi:hypothetical protein FQN54_007574 [Arachnomyces sp. PD_36]|nr:hypothetical protein FQN54_007574 [Arachnomyces sp. PD_36]